MNNRTTIYTLVIACVITATASSSALAGDSAGFEYLITNANMRTKGPETDKYVEMVLDIRSIHNLNTDVQFVVFGLTFKIDDANGTTTIPMNRYAVKTHEERFNLPISARIDEVIVAKWFDKTIPHRTQHDYQVLVPTNGRVMDAVQRSRSVEKIDGNLDSPTITILFRTVQVGHHAKDALSLLGNPLLPLEMRMDLARRISLAESKRYRFLNDAGTWIFPDGLDARMPKASFAEQAEPGVLIDTGKSETEGGIRAINSLSNVIYMGVAGNDRYSWKKIEPRRSVFFSLKPGLFALTIWNRTYSTRNVLLSPKRQYKYSIRFGK